MIVIVGILSCHPLCPSAARYVARCSQRQWQRQESSACGHGNAVGLTSILDRQQFLYCFKCDVDSVGS